MSLRKALLESPQKAKGHIIRCHQQPLKGGGERQLWETMAICEAPWLQMSPRYKCLKRTPPATIQLPIVPGDIATPTPSHSALCVVRTVLSVVPSCGSPSLQTLVQNVPRCDVMCCDVPCCAVLCCVVFRRAVCALPRFVEHCCAVLCCAAPGCAVLCRA